MITTKNILQHAPLGKATTYAATYQRDLLYPIARCAQRATLNISTLPFTGHDIWNAYELSWLNKKGKPMVAFAEFIIPCDSSHLIESKSFKLYLNSFNNTVFDDSEVVREILIRDLSEFTGSAVKIKLYAFNEVIPVIATQPFGECLDALEVAIDTYTPQANYLTTEMNRVSETLYSDLLKSNCPVTGQPDWASVQIDYSGQKINHAGLLQYIISFRNHEEFHEQCVERIFVDIMQHCQPEKLFVCARYTRRGGLDINPYRANYDVAFDNTRLWRQ